MNRSLQIRAGLVIVVVLLSLWGLLPTYQASRITSEEREAAKSDPVLQEKIDNLDARKIRQGLDLQGGMYLVLEVDQEGMSTDEARDALERVREILTNRIDQFGVSEPVIQIQGTSRIIVQLPGLQDAERAKALVGTTARLEFRLVRLQEDYDQVLERLDEALKRTAEAGLDPAAGSDPEADVATVDSAVDSAAAAVTLAAADSAADDPFGDLPSLGGDATPAAGPSEEMLAERPFTSYVYLDGNMWNYGTPLFVPAEYLERVRDLLASDAAGRVIPRDMEFQFDTEDLVFQDGLAMRPLYLLNKAAALTGDRLTNARERPDQQSPGEWLVEMNLDRRGARAFSRMTSENVGRQLAISLDGNVNSAPRIQGKIPNGVATITGGFTSDTAADLSLLLRAGALPTDVRIEEERTVGPSLGHDSIRMGLQAMLYGSLLVIVFILIYYRFSGLVVVLALITTILILLAVLGQFGLVLTLPGIAGIVLTVGMAVDANVLINERIREERRKDKTLRAAVESGYANATRTIIDANVTTLIVGVILLRFGTGPVKGFAVTLSIGILTSMFTALIMTRVIMELASREKGRRKLAH